MDDVTRRELLDEGISVDAALERFLGNEEMYISFLLRFFEDPNFVRLQDAFAAKDVKECFEASHAMKGVLLNLGMDLLNQDLIPLVEQFRAGSMEGCDELLKRYTEHYERLREHLNTLLR